MDKILLLIGNHCKEFKEVWEHKLTLVSWCPTTNNLRPCIECHWHCCYQHVVFMLRVEVTQLCANYDCLLVANVNVTDFADILASDWLSRGHVT